MGVDDNGEITGVNEEKLISFDRFQQRIAGITTEAIKPSISVKLDRYQVGNKTIIQINVPKGPEPAYYVDNIPFIRVLTTSRPATPLDVKNLHLRYFLDYLKNSAR